MIIITGSEMRRECLFECIRGRGMAETNYEKEKPYRFGKVFCTIDKIYNFCKKALLAYDL